jgi:hypothetical protein
MISMDQMSLPFSRSSCARDPGKGGFFRLCSSNSSVYGGGLLSTISGQNYLLKTARRRYYDEEKCNSQFTWNTHSKLDVGSPISLHLSLAMLAGLGGTGDRGFSPRALHTTSVASGVGDLHVGGPLPVPRVLSFSREYLARH